MSVPARIAALYTAPDGSFPASRTTAPIDLGTGARALLVLVGGDSGTPAGYSFTSAVVNGTGGITLTAGAEKTTTGRVRRAFWATDADGLPTGSHTITVNTNGTRNFAIQCIVYQDGAVSGASVSVTPTLFATTGVAGGANSYTVDTTTTTGLAVAVALCPGSVGTDASSTNATSYLRNANAQVSFEVFDKTGSATSTAITWQTAGSVTLQYDTFGFALLGSTAPTSVLGSNVTLDDTATGGGLSSVASSLGGNVTLDDVAPAGTLGAVPGTFTSEALKNWTGTLQASVALTYFRLYDPATGALVVSRTDLSTNSSGVVSFSDGAITAGGSYAADWLTAGGERRMPVKAAT